MDIGFFFSVVSDNYASETDLVKMGPSDVRIPLTKYKIDFLLFCIKKLIVNWSGPKCEQCVSWSIDKNVSNESDFAVSRVLNGEQKAGTQRQPDDASRKLTAKKVFSVVIGSLNSRYFSFASEKTSKDCILKEKPPQ